MEARACRDRKRRRRNAGSRSWQAAYKVALQQGIQGLTVRAVAAAAGLSHGLVLFHFKRKDQLVGAVLDRVLTSTLSLEVGEEIDRIEHPAERLPALLRREVDRLTRNAREARLFLEYWALGARHPALRAEDRRGARALSGGVPKADGGDAAG